MSDRVQVVLVTVPSQEVGAELSRKLVEEELAACVNLVGPIRSIYRWEGKTCDDAEWLCVIKTRAGRFAALRDRVLALHPYSVPEVIALDVASGSAAYLDWVLASTGVGR